MMSFITKLVILPALLALVRSDLPVEEVEQRKARNEFDPTIYRISEDLDPIHYDIEITPYFEDSGNNEPFTFDGIVTISMRTTRNFIEYLVVQENVREIESVTLKDEAGNLITIDQNNPFERIRAYHYLKVNLAEGVTLVNGHVYLLTIHYIGNINETPLSRGVFRGYTVGEDGRVHWYAATHLQPTNSRQAFPSFDEPGFKSTFNITINRPAHYTDTFSNMDIAQSIPNGDRVKEIFHTTPRMSAYLVTFHISEDFKVIADNNNTARSYRVLGRPGTEGQGDFALMVGPPITDWLGSYLGIDYYSMGGEMKNDQIASTFWASGATENWGLVTYRENRLLYKEGETNAADKMTIGTIIAHELAHKWFGNLITCRWWDNVWINEGFASYFEYFAMDGVDKTWELEDQFNIMYLQSALSSDASIATRALQHTVNTPAEVTGHFSGISYTKGASLLLMLKHFVTEDTFKKALNLFLRDREYEHAFPEDLYKAFAQAVAEDGTIDSGVDIYDFMKYWVDEPGYPVLNVDVNMDTGLMSISQERFFISATANPTEQVWPLPLTYTSGNNPNWEDLKPTHVMTGKTMEIQKDPGHEWVLFNVRQKGIYRVNYDTHNWQMLASALKANHNSIHQVNRAQIVDDVFALMRSEKMSYQLSFEVLDFLKQDTSYLSWYTATVGFNWLRNRFLHLPDTLAEFDEILLEFLEAVIADLGYDVVADEPLTRTLNRFYTLTFACNIGHAGCISNAVEKFAAFKNNGVRIDRAVSMVGFDSRPGYIYVCRNMSPYPESSVDPNLRRHVFCQGLREGGYDDWRFLYERRRTLASNNQADELAMLRALGCTTNEQAVQEYLEMILTDEVRAQDSVNAFTFLYMGDRRNANIALQFVKERIDDIRQRVVLATWIDSVIGNLAAYLDEEGLNDMEQWLRDNQGTIPEYTVGINSVGSARTSMQWGTDRASDIIAAIRGSATVIVPSTMLFITTLFALLYK